MRYQLVTLAYNGKSGEIDVTARGEDNRKKTFEVRGFVPYFFVPQDQEDRIVSNQYLKSTEYGYTSIFGESLLKLTMSDPLAVEKFRQSFDSYFEADIKYTRRFLIDSGIRNGFEAPEGRSSVFWRDLKPCDFRLRDLVCVTIDIEVDNTGVRSVKDLLEKTERPVICVSLHENVHNQIVTIILDDFDAREKWDDNHTVVRVTSEKRLLELVCSFLEKVQPDVLRNWNLYFDLDYLRPRGKKLGVDLAGQFALCAQFDQLEGYRKIFRKASNRLKDVVLDEKLTESVVAEEFRLDLYLDKATRDLFIKYSKEDVRYCVLIDNKHRLTQYYWQLKTFVGLEGFAPTFFNSTVVDCLMLRKAKQNGYVLPSARYGQDIDEEDKYKGAFVLEPEPGVEEDVAIFDMNKFYPMTMKAWHLSPERSDGLGIFTQIIDELILVRLDYDRMYKEYFVQYGENSEEYKSMENQRQTVKDTLNSVYGYAGFPYGRLFKKEVAADTARHCKEGILFVKARAESGDYVSPIDNMHKTFKAKYSDTDSLHIKMKIEEAPYFEEWLNEELKRWCESQGVEPLLRIEFEKYASTELFVEAKGEERGAKKNYGYWMTYKGGKKTDKIEIRGWDRRDSSKIGRQVRQKVVEMILRKQNDQIIPYVLPIVKDIKAGKAKIRDCCMNIGLHNDPEKYKSTTTYVRGALYANQYLGKEEIDKNGNPTGKYQGLGLKEGDLVKVIPVKRIPGRPPTDVICVSDEGQIPAGTVIDYNELVRITIQIKLESILKVVGINWSELSGQRTLSQLYAK